MANHKQTPDVLGTLLGGAEAQAPSEPDTSTPVHQQVDKSTSRQASKSTRQQAGKATKPQVSKETSQEARKAISQPEKPKATFYLSQETLASLEEAWIKLRKMARTEDRGAVSKSAIVEEAILLALEDLETMATRLKR